MGNYLEYSTEEWIKHYQNLLGEIDDWCKENFVSLPRSIQSAISSGIVRYQEMIKEMERGGCKK